MEVVLINYSISTNTPQGKKIWDDLNTKLQKSGYFPALFCSFEKPPSSGPYEVTLKDGYWKAGDGLKIYDWAIYTDTEDKQSGYFIQHSDGVHRTMGRYPKVMRSETKKAVAWLLNKKGATILEAARLFKVTPSGIRNTANLYCVDLPAYKHTPVKSYPAAEWLLTQKNATMQQAANKFGISARSVAAQCSAIGVKCRTVTARTWYMAGCDD